MVAEADSRFMSMQAVASFGRRLRMVPEPVEESFSSRASVVSPRQNFIGVRPPPITGELKSRR